MMESPNGIAFGFVTFIVRQWLPWHSIQLDLLKRSRAFKAIKNIPKRKADFDKICKVIIGTLYSAMPSLVIYGDIKTWTIK